MDDEAPIGSPEFYLMIARAQAKCEEMLEESRQRMAMSGVKDKVPASSFMCPHGMLLGWDCKGCKP